MSVLEVVVFVLEMIGTVVFSISGGLVGIERGLDYFGIPVLSMTTAVGGGMLRDLILGKTPPSMFLNPIYVVVAIVTSSLMLFLLHRLWQLCGEWKICQLYGSDYLFLMLWALESLLSSGVNTAFGQRISQRFSCSFCRCYDRCGRWNAARYHGKTHSFGLAPGDLRRSGYSGSVDLLLSAEFPSENTVYAVMCSTDCCTAADIHPFPLESSKLGRTGKKYDSTIDKIQKSLFVCSDRDFFVKK